MGFLKEFKTFAVKGNAMDMAVGVIIGGAFGKIVTSLVNDIIMPPVGALLGNTNFSDLKIDLSRVREVASSATEFLNAGAAEKTIEPIYWCYGAFIQQVLDFTILAFCVFMMVKAMNMLTKKKKEEEAPAPAPAPEPSAEEKLLSEIRDLLKEKK